MWIILYSIDKTCHLHSLICTCIKMHLLGSIFLVKCVKFMAMLQVEIKRKVDQVHYVFSHQLTHFHIQLCISLLSYIKIT
jgi:hypothetical protein